MISALSVYTTTTTITSVTTTAAATTTITTTNNNNDNKNKNNNNDCHTRLVTKVYRLYKRMTCAYLNNNRVTFSCRTSY